MMHGIKKAVTLVLAVAAGLAYAQVPQWENLYPSYRGLAFGGGKFVAVSGDGLIKTSSDGGASWSQVFLLDGGNVRNIYAVAYGDGRFVAIQNDRKFLQSADGAAWSVGSMTTSFDCTYLTYGDGGAFVGVNRDGSILYDEDGWTPAEASTEYFSHIAYGAGRYVAVGSGIASSLNAIRWSSVSGGNTPGGVGAVAFGGDKFVAVGANGQSVYTSPSGTEWASAPVSGGLSAGAADMTFGGDKFVAVGAGGKGSASSDGGASWTSFTLAAGDDFKAVKYGNSAYVAIGANGSLYTSANGSAWNKTTDGYAMSNRQIAHSESKFVAVGDSGASASANGREWVKGDAGKRLKGVAYGAGRFVAVGDSGALYSSADGAAWIKHEDAEGKMLSSVAFGGDKFVAGGKTYGGLIAVFTSEDGQAWEEIDPTAWNKQTQYPVHMCYGKDRFLAVIGSISGNNVEIMSSAGGVNGGKYWSKVLSESSNGYNIESIAYAGDRFVAVGTKATGETALLSSADGTSWTVKEGGPAGAKSATFAKGFYVIAADSGNIYASTDGNRWDLQRKATNRDLRTVYFGGDALLAAGAAGAMLYSSAAPVSVNHSVSVRRASPQSVGMMSIDRMRRAPVVTLSFTPNKPGAIAIYSLTGKQLYKQGLSAGERSIQLPERLKMSNSSVIVRYTGDGKAISQRFQFVR